MNQELGIQYDKNKFWIIKSKIEANAGFTIINKKDCQKLSALIEQQNYGNISVSTIYRFFLNNKLEQTPYLYTLNIFSKFCGFENWADFNREIICNIQNLEKEPVYEDKSNHKSLIKCCLLTKSFDALELFFNSNKGDFSKEEFRIYGREVYEEITSDEEVKTENFKEIFSNHYIQLSVIVYILSFKFITNNIENGISRIADLCKNKKFEYYILLNLILLKNYVDNSKDYLTRKCLSDLYNKDILLKIENSEINPVIFDRYLCCYLIHLKFNNLDQTKKIQILINKLNFNFSETLNYLLIETTSLISFKSKQISMKKINKEGNIPKINAIKFKKIELEKIITKEALSLFDEECLKKQCEITGMKFTNVNSCLTIKMKDIDLLRFEKWFYGRYKLLFNNNQQEISSRYNSYLDAYNHDYFSELSEA